MLVAGDVLRGDRELVPGSQAHRTVGKLTEADLRPLEIGEDADTVAGRVGARPYPAVDLKMIGLMAMAHVEPRYVEAGTDQRGDLLLA